MRECLRRKWPDHHGAGHLRGQTCEDVSGGSGLTTSASRKPKLLGCLRRKRPDHHVGEGISEVGFARMFRRRWPVHLSSGHLGTQHCEDVSGESGRTTMGQGISEVRVARISQAKMAWPPELRAFPKSELRECLRRKWFDHHGAGHLRSQNCEDVSGERGLILPASPCV